jgi:hypothetical protein
MHLYVINMILRGISPRQCQNTPFDTPFDGKMRRDAGCPRPADRLKELFWQGVVVPVQCHASKSLFLRARTS